MTDRTQQYLPSRAEALPSFAADQAQENIYLQASDGAVSHGILYRPADDPGSKVCVYVMHPRGPMSRHYLAGYIPSRGMALFGHDGRYLNNDSDCLHERLLLDIAAGMRHLRDLGYDTIVGVGNSGFVLSPCGQECCPSERQLAAVKGITLPEAGQEAAHPLGSRAGSIPLRIPHPRPACRDRGSGGMGLDAVRGSNP